jgi:RNA polymerase sigma factor (sigma-70 family)
MDRAFRGGNFSPIRRVKNRRAATFLWKLETSLPRSRAEASLLNDSELVEGLHRQDPAAIRHLSECLLPSVWRSVYVQVRGDRHLAEDIVSESVLALLKVVSAPDCEIQSPSAWLRTVAANKLRDHFRAAARVQHLIDQAASLASIPPVPQPSSREDLNEQRAAVRRVMDDLPEQYRLALEWKYIDDLSVRQIAERLALTEKAAESILFRARREFREELGRISGEDFPAPLSRNGTGCSDRCNDDKLAAFGPVVGDARVKIETPRSADFDELRQ